MDDKVNLAEKFALLDKPYSPVAFASGDGRLLPRRRRDPDIELDAGELFGVPKGVEHCPRADEEALVLLIEPAGTRNTGDVESELTADAVEI